MCVGYPATRGSDCVRSLPDRALRARACRSLVASPWTRSCRGIRAELCHWRSLAGRCAVRACGTPLPPGREYILYCRELQTVCEAREQHRGARRAEIPEIARPCRLPWPGPCGAGCGAARCRWPVRNPKTAKTPETRDKTTGGRAAARAAGRRDDYGEVAPHPRFMQSVVISRADTVGSFMCRGTHMTRQRSTRVCPPRSGTYAHTQPRREVLAAAGRQVSASAQKACLPRGARPRHGDGSASALRSSVCEDALKRGCLVYHSSECVPQLVHLRELARLQLRPDELAIVFDLRPRATHNRVVGE